MSSTFTILLIYVIFLAMLTEDFLKHITAELFGQKVQDMLPINLYCMYEGDKTNEIFIFLLNEKIQSR
ncbi:uncharacterized protein Smp_202220 [Schistosoma mansoni]|uniref:Uncharacterized protein n=1 Tax=Schistosoma mansoni TaxID=6183 RepID=G4VGY7_SCHMA|nr:uncharacterized protein Smp_202220 [Schistosoma mansoni]|eukprot:XP_018650872.1 uncharacterized protein Smp_202220 [Schistosoma mansoni]